MDVALGVSVTGALARLALVESDAYGDAVLDESLLDLTQNPVELLAETVTGTQRALAEQGHRLAATRLCWPDPVLLTQLRQALADAGIENVSEHPTARSAVALARNSADSDGQTAAWIPDPVIDATTAAPALSDSAVPDGSATELTPPLRPGSPNRSWRTR